MKKILCPTDFSETADNGIVFAAKLAQRTSATITLFHVESLMEQTVGSGVMGEEYNVQEAMFKLSTQSEQVHRAFKVSIEPSVQPTLRSVIYAIADEARDYDLVVMGSGGPHDLVQFMMGSHTYRIMRQSYTPLLLVPAGYAFSEIRKIVFAYDYLKHSKLPLDQALSLSKALGAELTILQVSQERYSRPMEEKLEEIQKRVRDLYPDENIVFNTVYASDVVGTLHSFVKRNEMDMLVLCTEDHGFLEGLFHKSTMKAMSVIAEYPVLFTHE